MFMDFLFCCLDPFYVSVWDSKKSKNFTPPLLPSICIGCVFKPYLLPLFRIKGINCKKEVSYRVKWKESRFVTAGKYILFLTISCEMPLFSNPQFIFPVAFLMLSEWALSSK